MTEGPTVKSGAADDGVAVREEWNKADDSSQKTAGICGLVVQFQYGRAKSFRPVSSRPIPPKYPRYARCHGRMSQLPCRQKFLWIWACRSQLRGSVLGRACIALIAAA